MRVKAVVSRKGKAAHTHDLHTVSVVFSIHSVQYTQGQISGTPVSLATPAPSSS